MDPQDTNQELLFRWRLILGDEAEQHGLHLNSMMENMPQDQLISYSGQPQSSPVDLDGDKQIEQSKHQRNPPKSLPKKKKVKKTGKRNKTSKAKASKHTKSNSNKSKSKKKGMKNELKQPEDAKKSLKSSQNQNLLEKTKHQLQNIDQTLQFCYDYKKSSKGKKRNSTNRGRRKNNKRGGSEASNLTVPTWLKHIKTLFPHDVCEVLETDLIKNRGIEELINTPELLDKVEPSFEMTKIILQYKDIMSPAGKKAAKRMIRKVVEEVKDQLRTDVIRSITGALQKNKYTPHKRFQNLDLKKTLRRNLKNWNPDLEKVIVDQMFFHAREKKRKPWHIITVIDESGSMLDSIIHSAIMASIFWEIPSVKSSLVIFDTQVVDLSSEVEDPVEVLMSVQLGGGTDIAKAISYTKSLIVEPQKTIVVLITDFFEGGNRQVLLTTVKNIIEGKTKMIGLASIGPDPSRYGYDKNLASKMSQLGMEVLSCTPQKLSDLIGKIIET